MVSKQKELGNVDMLSKNNVEVYGDPSKWVCICKAWCVEEGWMKSTKVMELPLGYGCLVQVTTQQGENIAEALAFVPNVNLKNFQAKR